MLNKNDRTEMDVKSITEWVAMESHRALQVVVASRAGQW